MCRNIVELTVDELGKKKSTTAAFSVNLILCFIIYVKVSLIKVNLILFCHICESRSIQGESNFMFYHTCEVQSNQSESNFMKIIYL